MIYTRDVKHVMADLTMQEAADAGPGTDLDEVLAAVNRLPVGVDLDDPLTTPDSRAVNTAIEFFFGVTTPPEEWWHTEAEEIRETMDRATDRGTPRSGP